jgi:sugar phosphate isomerase/epimerase
MSVFDWILMAKDLRVEGLEMYDRFFTSLDHDYLLKVKRAVNALGFTIPMLVCSPDFTHPNPNEREKAVEYQLRMIEVAALLGGEGVVCRTLSGQQREGVSREDGVQWVVEGISAAIPYAKKHGVVLGMENHYKDSQWLRPEFALKQDIFLEIIQAIDERHHFGVQYDPSNAIVAGEDPIDLLRKVKDRVVSMHASDRYLKNGVSVEQLYKIGNGMGYSEYLSHGVIGRGLNDYDKIFSILSGSGFNGWVSVEDGMNGLAEIRESLSFLEGMCRKYYGK